MIDKNGRPLTGKKNGRYFYKGIEWFGPSNLIGHMPFGAQLIPDGADANRFGLMSLGLGVRVVGAAE